MDRKEFFKKSLQSGLGCCGLLGLSREAAAAAPPRPAEQEPPADRDSLFVQNWLSDLLAAMDAQLDREARVKLMEAYKKNFEIWREGDLVHIRYGEVSDHCYCPAANYRPAKPGDIHCECTRSTHQTIFETALGRPFKVDIADSLRRGGKTCHFIVHLT
jgi:hypothetical protein